jgi:HSP20 family protein
MTRSLVRWNPISNDLFRNRMSRLVDEAFNDFLAPVTGMDETLGSNWLPPVDVHEDGDQLVFTAEVPGIPKDAIEITVENRLLTLSGERKFEREEDRDQYHRIERAYGTFSRTFRLPANVDASQAKATFDNGVLTVSLPKSEEAKPKKLEIS